MKNFKEKAARAIAMGVVCSVMLFASCGMDEVKNEIDDLKKRVENLETLTGVLDKKIKDGVFVTKVKALEAPKSGWLVEFTSGDPIEILNGAPGATGAPGEKGADGHTPSIEVKENGDLWVDGKSTGINLKGEQGQQGKQGPAGTPAVPIKIDVRPITGGEGLSIWYNVTENYPEDGWIDTGVKISEPNEAHPLKAIVENAADGTVTFILNDENRTEYTFGLYGAVVQGIEVMALRSVELIGSATKEVTFIVNPSTAVVPTGTGAAISRWKLNDVATYKTRVSYVDPSEVFSITEIKADGEKQGQYIATIASNQAKHDFTVEEYAVALVLNNNTGADASKDVLVSSRVFGVKLIGAMVISPPALVFEAEGGTLTANVQSAEEWSVTTQTDWLTVEKGEGSFTVTATANESYKPGTGSVTVDNGFMTQTVTVTRKGATVNFISGKLGQDWGSAFTGAGTHNFYLEFADHDTSVSNPKGLKLQLEFVTTTMDDSKPILDIPVGSYPVSSAAGPGRIATGGNSVLMIIPSSWTQPNPSVVGGNVTVEGDHTEYTMKFDIILKDGSEFSGKFTGPIEIKNRKWPVDLGTMTGISQFQCTPDGYKDGTVDVWMITAYSAPGVYLDANGNLKGDGWFLLAQVHTPLNSGVPMLDGVYEIKGGYEPMTALPGYDNFFQGKGGLRAGRLEGGVQKELKTLSTGTLTSVYADGEYTISIVTEDQNDAPVTVVVKGAPPVTPASVK